MATNATKCNMSYSNIKQREMTLGCEVPVYFNSAVVLTYCVHVLLCLKPTLNYLQNDVYKKAYFSCPDIL